MRGPSWWEGGNDDHTQGLEYDAPWVNCNTSNRSGSFFPVAEIFEDEQETEGTPAIAPCLI
jgi:hypothetical protein